MLIEFTEPEQTNPGEYEFILFGLVDCKCITSRKTIEEARQTAKDFVNDYLKRMELSAHLEAILEGKEPPKPIERESGWTGIVFCMSRNNWKVTCCKDWKKYYNGYHNKLSNAVVAKMALNVRLGFEKFHGFKG